jgi:hypothetical protein
MLAFCTEVFPTGYRTDGYWKVPVAGLRISLTTGGYWDASDRKQINPTGDPLTLWMIGNDEEDFRAAVRSLKQWCKKQEQPPAKSESQTTTELLTYYSSMKQHAYNALFQGVYAEVPKYQGNGLYLWRLVKGEAGFENCDASAFRSLLNIWDMDGKWFYVDKHYWGKNIIYTLTPNHPQS